jgi:hypothetical protein
LITDVNYGRPVKSRPPPRSWQWKRGRALFSILKLM